MKSREDRSISFRNPSTPNAPLRYFLVALCGFSADYIIYAAIVFEGGSAYMANIAGFCIGAMINVILIRIFVFPESRFRLGADILLTNLTNGAALGLGMGILWVQIEVLSVNPYWAKLVTNGLTFVLNYATRSILFRKK